MEHIDGENLDVLVKRKGRLDENFIKAYTVQILDAIIYMHYTNIIHRYFLFYIKAYELIF
jgi:serine/threonine protein kinase